MNGQRNPVYLVGEVEIDPGRARLRRGSILRPLRQKPFQVLVYLIERRGEIVTKHELMENVWKDTTVTDDALVQCVKSIRQALGDDSRNPQLVQTLPKLGYRFIGPVEERWERWEGAASLESEESVSLALEYEEEVPDPPTAFPLWKQPRILIASLLLSGAIAVGVIAWHRNDALPATQAMPQVPGTTSLAVMYFKNQTGTAELDWLREGLCDMLITDLSQSNKLQVLSRQHLGLLMQRAGEGHALSSAEALNIARRARVQHVVVGSFAAAGGKIRVDAQLQEVATGQVLAAEGLVIDKPEQLLVQVDILAASLLGHMQKSDGSLAQGGLADLRTENLDAYRYYSLAVEKSRSLHSADAVALLQKAIALDPEFAMAHARIGYTYAVSWGIPEKGQPYLEKAASLSHRLTEKDKLTVRAWYAIAKRDYPQAISVFHDIIQRYPREVETYHHLGNLLQGEERYEEAIEVLKRGLEVDPDAEGLYNAIGGTYSVMGQHDRAISAHQRYVALVPQEPNAHDSLGLSYDAAGQYEKAIEEFDRALALDPEFEIAALHLGNAYYKLGQFQAALRQYARYVHIAPSDLERARGYGYIARVHRARRQRKLAEAAAQKQASLGLTPSLEAFLVAADSGDMRRAAQLSAQLAGNWDFNGRGRREPQRTRHYSRGYLALKQHESKQAIAGFQEALRHPPLVFDMDALEDCLASAYLQFGQLDEAIAEYQRVLLLNPRYPAAHFGLAQAYERKGAVAQAYSEYEQFLKVWEHADRDVPQIQEAEARLRARASVSGISKGPG